MDRRGLNSEISNLIQVAHWETTRRLLACLINEDLVHVEDSNADDVRELTLRPFDEKDRSSAFISVLLDGRSRFQVSQNSRTEIYAEHIIGPALIRILGSSGLKREYQPGRVWEALKPWVCKDPKVAAEVGREMQNSADWQVEWLKFASSRPLPDLNSPLLEFEQLCIFGHLDHPMHRSFVGLGDTKMTSIDERLLARLNILSVPRHLMRIDGPFEDLIKELLDKLNIEVEERPDQILVPCFSEQMSAIYENIGSYFEVVLERKLHGRRQASMRTVSIDGFPYHLKMSLSCTISSARRTMTPWTTLLCIEVSNKLKELVQKALPNSDLLWICGKVATACSAEEDYEKAKHLSVMLREDPEPKANVLGQALVLPVTLFERAVSVDDSGVRFGETHAVRIFKLDSEDKRHEWLRDYAGKYLEAVVPLVVEYGICLEAHQQNILLRFDRETHDLQSFVYRDMGGLRMHTPTMREHGVTIESAAKVKPGAVILTEDLDAVWKTAYHNFIANHLGGALRGLELDQQEGWKIVRKELVRVVENLKARSHAIQRADAFLRFMLQPVVDRKAFLRMKFDGVYRERRYTTLKNPLYVQDGPGV